MAGHQAASDGEAKLSAAYASRYYVAPNMADGPFTSGRHEACGNCGQFVEVVRHEEREPLCTVCWAMLQTSIKRAAKQGFRIG